MSTLPVLRTTLPYAGRAYVTDRFFLQSLKSAGNCRLLFISKKELSFRGAKPFATKNLTVLTLRILSRLTGILKRKDGTLRSLDRLGMTLKSLPCLKGGGLASSELGGIQ